MKQAEKITKTLLSLNTVAVLTLVSFLLTQVIISVPESFAIPVDRQVRNSNVPGSDPAPVSTAQASATNHWTNPFSGRLNNKIAVPPELGKIEELFQGTSDKTIIFIQDAHDSLEAQENIGKLIGRFVKESGIRTVFEEGYEGSVPTDKFFGFIKNSKIKQKVSYFLLDKLRLGGAEYAHVNRTQDFDLIGVDSFKLYSENIKAYRESSKSRKETEADLDELFNHVSILANRHFPKELKSWLRSKERSSKGELPLLDYLKTLQSLYPKTKPDLSQFPQEYPALSILLMAETTKDKKLITQLNALDSKVVFEEMNRLEQGLSKAFLQNDRAKQIFDYYQGLSLLKRLNQIQLTQSEYEVVKETLEHFKTRELADFIVSLTHKSLVLSKEWERHIKNAVQFYNAAQTRDHSINEHLKSFIKDGKEDAAVLVFGGFHATAIKDLLREQGISYVVVSPGITKIEKRHQEYYKQLMSVGHHTFEVPFFITRASKPPSIFFSAAIGGEEMAARSELYAIASSVEVLGNNSDSQLIERRLVGFNQARETQSVGAATETSKPRSEIRMDPERAREMTGKLWEMLSEAEAESSQAQAAGQADRVRYVQITIDEILKALAGLADPWHVHEATMKIVNTYVPDLEVERFDLASSEPFRMIKEGDEAQQLKPNPERARHMVRVERFFRALTTGDPDYFIRRLKPGTSEADKEKYRQDLGRIKAFYDAFTPDEKTEMWLEIKAHDIGYASGIADVGHAERGAASAETFIQNELHMSVAMARAVAALIRRHTLVGWLYLGELRYTKFMEGLDEKGFLKLVLHNIADAASVLPDGMVYYPSRLATVVEWFTPEARDRSLGNYDQYRFEKLAKSSENSEQDLTPDEVLRLNAMIRTIFGYEEKKLREKWRDSIDIFNSPMMVSAWLAKRDPSYKRFSKWMRLLGHVSLLVPGGEAVFISNLRTRDYPVPLSQAADVINLKIEAAIDQIPDVCDLAAVKAQMPELSKDKRFVIYGIPFKWDGKEFWVDVASLYDAEQDRTDAKVRSEMRDWDDLIFQDVRKKSEEVERLKWREQKSPWDWRDWKEKNNWLGRLRLAVHWWADWRLKYDHRLVNLFGEFGPSRDREVAKVSEKFRKKMEEIARKTGRSFFIYSGGSGAEKSTMWDYLTEHYKGQYRKFIIYTTRDRRADEKIGDLERGVEDGGLFRALEFMLQDPKLQKINVNNIQDYQKDLFRVLQAANISLSDDARKKLEGILKLDKLGEDGMRVHVDPDNLDDQDRVFPPEITLSERIGYLLGSGKNKIRAFGEFEGVQYHFASKENLKKLETEGKVVIVMMDKTPQGFSPSTVEAALNSKEGAITVLECAPDMMMKIKEMLGADRINTFFVSTLPDDQPLPTSRAPFRSEARERVVSRGTSDVSSSDSGLKDVKKKQDAFTGEALPDNSRQNPTRASSLRDQFFGDDYYEYYVNKDNDTQYASYMVRRRLLNIARVGEESEKSELINGLFDLLKPPSPLGVFGKGDAFAVLCEIALIEHEATARQALCALVRLLFVMHPDDSDYDYWSRRIEEILAKKSDLVANDAVSRGKLLGVSKSIELWFQILAWSKKENTPEKYRTLLSILETKGLHPATYVSANYALGTIAKENPGLLDARAVVAFARFLEMEDLPSEVYISCVSAVRLIAKERFDLITFQVVRALGRVLGYQLPWFRGRGAPEAAIAALIELALMQKAPASESAVKCLFGTLSTEGLDMIVYYEILKNLPPLLKANANILSSEALAKGVAVALGVCGIPQVGAVDFLNAVLLFQTGVASKFSFYSFLNEKEKKDKSRKIRSVEIVSALLEMNPKHRDNVFLNKVQQNCLLFSGAGPTRSEMRGAVDEYLTRLEKEGFSGQLSRKNGKFEKIGRDAGNERLGWVDVVPQLVAKPGLLQQVKYEAETIRKGGYKHVVLVGMGLRSAEVAMALRKDNLAPEIHILDTTDIGAINVLLAGLGISAGDKASIRRALETTLFIGVSKGGTTFEALKNLDYFKQLMADHEIDPKKNMWVMTDPDSPMARGYGTQGFKVLSIQLDGKTDIGGRFAAPGTRIFLLTAAIRGQDPELLLRQYVAGVNTPHAAFEKEREAPYLRLAAMLAAKGGKKKVSHLIVFLPDELKPLWKWIEAIFEETLGKNGAGVMVWDGDQIDPNVFNSREHPAVVLNVKVESSGELPHEMMQRTETMKILEERGVLKQELPLRSKRELVSLLEGLKKTVAAVGYLWNVNIVNQPVHQRNKAALHELSHPSEAVAVSDTFDPVMLSGHITSSTDYVELRFYGQPTDDELRELNKLKRMIEKQALVPAKISIAPAADHATLQRMSEGPQNSAVIIFARPEPEIAVGRYEDGLNMRFAVQAYRELQKTGRVVSFISLQKSSHQSAYQLREIRRLLAFHMFGHLKSANFLQKITPILLRLKHQGHLSPEAMKSMHKFKAALGAFEKGLKPATRDEDKLNAVKRALSAAGIESEVLFRRNVTSPDGVETYREIRYLKVQFLNEDWILSTGCGPLHWEDYGLTLFPMRFIKHFRDLFWFYESHEILPSILEVKSEQREDLLKMAVESGITHFHIDQADGHFVKRETDNLAAATLIRSILPSAFVEVHLMVSGAKLQGEVEKCIRAGVQRVYFHIEAFHQGDELREYIRLLHRNGIQAGLTLNPETDIGNLEPYLSSIDAILIMDVEPGGGGRSFQAPVLTKTWELYQKIQESGYYIDLISDGGIGEHTSKLVIRHGADDVVTGAFIFGKSGAPHDITEAQGAVDKLKGAMFDTQQKIIEENVHFARAPGEKGYVLLLPHPVTSASRKIRYPHLLNEEFVTKAPGNERKFLRQLQASMRRSWDLYQQAMNRQGPFFDVLVFTTKEATADINRQKIEELRGIAYPAGTPVILVIEPDGLMRDSLSGVVNAAAQATEGIKELGLNPLTARVLLVQMAGEASRNRPLSGSVAAPGKQWTLSPSGQSLFERTIFESLQFFDRDHPGWLLRAVDQSVGVGVSTELLLEKSEAGFTTFGAYYPAGKFPLRFHAAKIGPDGRILRTREKPESSDILEFVNGSEEIAGLFFIRKLSHAAVQGLIEAFKKPSAERPLPLYENYHLNESFQFLDAANFSEDEEADLKNWIRAYFDAKGSSLSRNLPVLFPDYLAIRDAAMNFRRKYGMTFRSIGKDFVFEDTGTNQAYTDIFKETLRSKALQILFDVFPDEHGDILVDSTNINIDKKTAGSPLFVMNSHDVSGQSRGPLVMIGVDHNSVDAGPDTLICNIPPIREVIHSPGGMLESFAIVEHVRFRLSYPLGANPQRDMSVRQFGPGGRYSFDDIWQEVKNRSRGRSEAREILLPRIELVVLDLDGTLYDSPALLQAYRDAAYDLYRSRFGGSFDEAREQVEGRRALLRGQDKPHGDRDVLESFGFTYEEKIANEIRRIDIAEYLRPDPVLKQKLEKLRKRCRLVLSTNNTNQATARILEALGLIGLFEKIYTQESTGIHKPDPRVFELIQRDLGIPFSGMLSVGDRKEADILPAMALGMHGMLVRGPSDLASDLENRFLEIEAGLVRNLFTENATVPRWREIFQRLSSGKELRQEVKIVFDNETGRSDVSFSIPVRLLEALLEPVLIPYISALLNNRAMTVGFSNAYITGLPEKAGASITSYLKEKFSQIDHVSRDFYGHVPHIKFAPAPEAKIAFRSAQKLKVAGAFRHDRGTFIGANVGQTDIKFVLLVNGEFRQERTLSIPTWTDPQLRTFQGIYAGIVRGIGELLSRSGISPDKIDGIGLSVGGIVKEHRMTTKSGIAYGMSDEDFSKIRSVSEILSDQMNCPVILDQDVVSKGIALVSRYHLKKTLILDLGTSLGSLSIDKEGAIPVQVNQSGRVSIDLSEGSFDRPDKAGKGVLSQYLSGTGLTNMGSRNGLTGFKNQQITEFLEAGDARAKASLEAMTVNLIHSILELSQYYDFNTVLLTGGLINSEFGKALISAAREKIKKEKIKVALIKSDLDPTYEGAIGAADLINWSVQNTQNRSEARSLSEPFYKNLREQHTFFNRLKLDRPEEELITIAINYSDIYGNETDETLKIPAGFFADHSERVHDYMAVLIANRALFSGFLATDIATLFDNGDLEGDLLRALQSLPADVERCLREVFGGTQKIIDYLRYLQHGTAAFMKQRRIRVDLDIPVPFNMAKALGSDSIGVDIGGTTNIKFVVIKNGQVADKREIAISGLPGTVGDHINTMLGLLAKEHGLKLPSDQKIYITVPGIILFGNPWILPNLEVLRPGSLQSLMDLKKARPNIEYISDSKAAGFFVASAGGISDNTIINTLGTGLGLAIISDGKVSGVPNEAHIRWDLTEQARWNPGYGFRGDLESYANAEFVVNRFNELSRELGLDLQVSTAKQVGEFLAGKEATPALIAQNVFLEFGKNLSALYGEISRVIGKSRWDVILTGGIARDVSGELIVRGIREGIANYPDLKIEKIIVSNENQYSGALGAAYLGISGYSWKKRSESRAFKPVARAWENGPRFGSPLQFLNLLNIRNWQIPRLLPPEGSKVDYIAAISCSISKDGTASTHGRAIVEEAVRLYRLYRGQGQKVKIVFGGGNKVNGVTEAESMRRAAVELFPEGSVDFITDRSPDEKYGTESLMPAIQKAIEEDRKEKGLVGVQVIGVAQYLHARRAISLLRQQLSSVGATVWQSPAGKSEYEIASTHWQLRQYNAGLWKWTGFMGEKRFFMWEIANYLKSILFFKTRDIKKPESDAGISDQSSVTSKEILPNTARSEMQGKHLAVAESILKHSYDEKDLPRIYELGQKLIQYVNVQQIYDVGTNSYRDLNGDQDLLAEGPFDAMVVFGSGYLDVPGEAARIGHELRKKNLALKTIVVGNYGTDQQMAGNFVIDGKRVSEAEYFGKVMNEFGVPPDFMGKNSTNTLSNVREAREVADRNGLRPKRVIIVSIQHRRAGPTFTLHYPREGESLSSLGLEKVAIWSPEINLDEWNENEAIAAIKDAVEEIRKIQKYSKQTKPFGITPTSVPAEILAIKLELRQLLNMPRSEMRKEAEEIKEIVEKAYGLHVNGEPKVLTGSFWGKYRGYEPYVIETRERGRLAFKFLWKRPEKARYAVEFMQRLKEYGLPVPELVPRRDVTASDDPTDVYIMEHQGAFYVLETFLAEGREILRENATEEHFRKVGKLAARIQNAVEEFQPRHLWRFKTSYKVYETLSAAFPEMEKAVDSLVSVHGAENEVVRDVLRRREQLRTLVEAQLSYLEKNFPDRGLRFTHIHNDLYLGNLKFANDGSISALFDFNLVQADHRIAEFNNLLFWMIKGSDSTLWPKMFRAVLAGYEQTLNVPLTLEEKVSIWERLRLRFIEEVTRVYSTKPDAAESIFHDPDAKRGWYQSLDVLTHFGPEPFIYDGRSVLEPGDARRSEIRNARNFGADVITKSARSDLRNTLKYQAGFKTITDSQERKRLNHLVDMIRGHFPNHEFYLNDIDPLFEIDGFWSVTTTEREIILKYLLKISEDENGVRWLFDVVKPLKALLASKEFFNRAISERIEVLKRMNIILTGILREAGDRMPLIIRSSGYWLLSNAKRKKFLNDFLRIKEKVKRKILGEYSGQRDVENFLEAALLVMDDMTNTEGFWRLPEQERLRCLTEYPVAMRELQKDGIDVEYGITDYPNFRAEKMLTASEVFWALPRLDRDILIQKAQEIRSSVAIKEEFLRDVIAYRTHQGFVGLLNSFDLVKFESSVRLKCFELFTIIAKTYGLDIVAARDLLKKGVSSVKLDSLPLKHQEEILDRMLENFKVKGLQGIQEYLSSLVSEAMSPNGKSTRSEVRFLNLTSMMSESSLQIIRRIKNNAQPVTIFLNAADFPNLSEAQKREYFFVALVNKAIRIVVYNEHGQAWDKDLAALLKLGRVSRTDKDLGQTIHHFANPSVPVIQLSKKLLPSTAEIRKFRGRVAFFKTSEDKSGTLAMALLWAISGGEDIRMPGVRQENGFWTVEESLLDSLQRIYDNNFVVAIAA